MGYPKRPKSIVLHVHPEVFQAVKALEWVAMEYLTDAGPDTIPICRADVDGVDTVVSIKKRADRFGDMGICGEFTTCVA